MTTYRPAPAAERIAKELIPQHHEHLTPCEIRYLFIDPIPRSHGKSTMGRARKVSGLNAYLLAQPGLDPEIAHDRLEGGDFELFVIEFAETIWNELDDRQRHALVDHELSHCWAGEDHQGRYRLSMRGHDVEEFRTVIERHGIWKPDIEAFARTVEQLTLTDRWHADTGEQLETTAP